MLSYSADKVDAPPVSTKDPPSSSVDTTPAEPIRKEVNQQEEIPSAVSGPAPTSIPPIPPVPSELVIERPVRATITLYPIGRPVRATITLYPIGRPVRATITLYPIGRPVRATITLYPIGRPVRATITLYPIGRPVITLYHLWLK